MIVSDMYSVKDYPSHRKLVSLPPSAKFILYLLKRNGILNQQEILKKSLLSKRTIVFSLNKLHQEDFIRKFSDGKDKRVRYYEILI